MHSRILHLSTNDNESPLNCDKVKQLDFVHGQVDYVRQSDNITQDIINFADSDDDLPILYTEDTLTFPYGFREDYFRNKLEALKSEVENLDLETYMTYVPHYLLHADTNVGGYKVYSEEEGIYDFDDFVRFSLEEDVEYRVLNSIDYHY